MKKIFLLSAETGKGHLLTQEEFEIWKHDGSVQPGDVVYTVTVHSTKVVEERRELVLCDCVQEGNEP